MKLTLTLTDEQLSELQDLACAHVRTLETEVTQLRRELNRLNPRSQSSKDEDG